MAKRFKKKKKTCKKRPPHWGSERSTTNADAEFTPLHMESIEKKQKTTGDNSKPERFCDHCALGLFPKKERASDRITVDKDSRVKKDSFLINKIFKLMAINTHPK